MRPRASNAQSILLLNVLARMSGRAYCNKCFEHRTSPESSEQIGRTPAFLDAQAPLRNVSVKRLTQRRYCFDCELPVLGCVATVLRLRGRMTVLSLMRDDFFCFVERKCCLGQVALVLALTVSYPHPRRLRPESCSGASPSVPVTSSWSRLGRSYALVWQSERFQASGYQRAGGVNCTVPFCLFPDGWRHPRRDPRSFGNLGPTLRRRCTGAPQIVHHMATDDFLADINRRPIEVMRFSRTSMARTTPAQNRAVSAR